MIEQPYQVPQTGIEFSEKGLLLCISTPKYLLI